MSDFYKYFNENMASLGLAAPAQLFGTFQAAIANTLVFMAHIDKFGTGVKVSEPVIAGTKLERLGFTATLGASYYVGAVIGSIAVATGRSLAGGVTIADVLLTANQHNLNRPWLAKTLSNSPNIYRRPVHRNTR